MYCESRGEDSCEDVSVAPLLVFFPVNPRPHYMGVGRIEKGDSDIDRRSTLNRGSGCRQRVVERYIFGTQSREKKDNINQVGGPRDVKTQTQVSKKVS